MECRLEHLETMCPTLAPAPGPSTPSRNPGPPSSPLRIFSARCDKSRADIQNQFRCSKVQQNLRRLLHPPQNAGTTPSFPICISDSEDNEGDCEIIEAPAQPFASRRGPTEVFSLQPCGGNALRRPPLFQSSSDVRSEFVSQLQGGNCSALPAARERKRRKLPESAPEPYVGLLCDDGPRDVIDLTTSWDEIAHGVAGLPCSPGPPLQDKWPTLPIELLSDDLLFERQQTLRERDFSDCEESDVPDFGAFEVTVELVKLLREGATRERAVTDHDSRAGHIRRFAVEEKHHPRDLKDDSDGNVCQLYEAQNRQCPEIRRGPNRIPHIHSLLVNREVGAMHLGHRGSASCRSLWARSIVRRCYSPIARFSRGSKTISDIQFAGMRGRPKFAVSSTCDPLAEYNLCGNLLLGDIESGKLLNLEGHVGLNGLYQTVAEILFSADGERLFSASWDSTVKMWDAGDGNLIKSVAVGSSAKRLAVHSNLYTVAAAEDSRKLTLMNFGDGSSVDEPDVRVLSEAGMPITEMTFGVQFPDILLAACGEVGRGQILIFDLTANKKFKFSDRQIKGDISCLYCSRSGKYIVTGSSANCAVPRGHTYMFGRLVPVPDPRELVRPHPTNFASPAISHWQNPAPAAFAQPFSPVANVGATYDLPTDVGEGKVRVLLWESAGLGMFWEAWTGQADQNVVTMSPCERFVTSSATDNATFVFDLRRNDRPLHILNHAASQFAERPVVDDGVTSCKWAMGAMLFTGGADGKVRVWDVGLGNPAVATLGSERTDGDPVAAVGVSNDGMYVASGHDSGNVEVWSVRKDLCRVWDYA